MRDVVVLLSKHIDRFVKTHFPEYEEVTTFFFSCNTKDDNNVDPPPPPLYSVVIHVQRHEEHGKGANTSRHLVFPRLAHRSTYFPSCSPLHARDSYIHTRAQTNPPPLFPSSLIHRRHNSNHYQAKGRLLYYFPLSEEESKNAGDDSWIGWHNDSGFLTALAGDMYVNDTTGEKVRHHPT
jgi:hypothetical protein